METELERTKPVAAFMAFGTKGDVYPVAAIAAAFASDQKHYHVVLITHSAHQDLSSNLAGKPVAFCPISSPPVVSTPQNHDATGLLELMFRLKKREVNAEHRKECYSAVERIFGSGPSLEGDFIVINFFALEGWSLAELFRVRCIVAAPYVIPYSAPSSFEHCFVKEHPLLYKYLQEAPINKDPVTGLPTWYDRVPSPKLLYGFSKEVVECPGVVLRLGEVGIDLLKSIPACTVTGSRRGSLASPPMGGTPTRDPISLDPITRLDPYLVDPSPLPGPFSNCSSPHSIPSTDYWPSSVRVCGFWFLPIEWQFSCKKCEEISILSSRHLRANWKMCAAHVEFQSFLETPKLVLPIFIGLSSIASMGFLKNPRAFLLVLRTVLETTGYRFVLSTAGYEPLDAAIQAIAAETSSFLNQSQIIEDGVSLFDGTLFCFSG
ncbi:hypothetical protein Pint_22259 [Pistacia integerrima]|uniref:Uncharacterized protein n=1 Tax=Pistacia integerrima TaxID=434235 RepID=A0ACC0YGV3_9ROSI|nr:hypothetical protein Pint_22259 [Pistacia integerrima]